MAQPPKTLTVFNSASGAAVVAPDSIASAFGKQIGASTAVATSLTLPITLGGVSVNVMGSMAALFYVSPNQINFVVPHATAMGMATVTIMNGDAMPPSTMVQVAAVAPRLFNPNSPGTGEAPAPADPPNIGTYNRVVGPGFHCQSYRWYSSPHDIPANPK